MDKAEYLELAEQMTGIKPIITAEAQTNLTRFEYLRRLTELHHKVHRIAFDKAQEMASMRWQDLPADEEAIRELIDLMEAAHRFTRISLSLSLDQ